MPLSARHLLPNNVKVGLFCVEMRAAAIRFRTMHSVVKRTEVRRSIVLAELGGDDAVARATESDEGRRVKICVYTYCAACYA